MIVRRALVIAAMALVVLGGSMHVAAAKYRGSDTLGNVLPRSQMPAGSLMDRYPTSAYALDFHVDSGPVGLDVTSWPAVAGQWLVAGAWSITVMVLMLVLRIFLWAFSLDLLSSGTLGPLAGTMRNLHEQALGHWWIIIGVLLAGMWGTYVGLAHRRTNELFAGLARSILFAVIALMVIYDPGGTVGAASRAVNQFSLQLLASASGHPGADDAQATIADSVFLDRVYRPWRVLEFDGLETCADYDRRDQDGFPKPVPVSDASHDVCRSTNVYAERYLRQAPGSKERQAEYDALREGQLPFPAGPQFAGYQVSKADAGAVDAQQEDGTMQRVAMGALVLAGVWGTIVVLAFLSLAALLVQLLTLLLMVAAPAAFIVGMVPGWGHRMFESWGKALLTAVVLVKPGYALVLGIVLGISSALTGALSSLGFLLAFVLSAAFWWFLFFYRRHINSHMNAHHDHAHRIVTQQQRVVTQKASRHARAATVAMAATPAAGGAMIWQAGSKARQDRQEQKGTNGTNGNDGKSAIPNKPTSPNKPATAGREYSPTPTPPKQQSPTPAPTPQATQVQPTEKPPEAKPTTPKREPVTAGEPELRFKPKGH